MPQLVTSVDQADRFELVAERAGADYVEIALTVDVAEQIRRFSVKASCSEVNAYIDQAVKPRVAMTCSDVSIDTSAPTSLSAPWPSVSAPLTLASPSRMPRCSRS